MKGFTLRAALIAVVVATASGLATANVTSSGAATNGGGKAKIDRSAVLRFGMPVGENSGSSFDPANARPNPANVEWMDLIYDVMINDTTDRKGRPGLATKWATPDATTVELTLQKGVKFTDGTPFNAAAVKAAWDRVVASGQANLPPEVKAITNVEAIGDDGIRVSFSTPSAGSFVSSVLRHSGSLAVPSPTAVAKGDLNVTPVGAGPYMLKDYTPDQRIVLTKNPTYYDPKAQLLGGVEFLQAQVGQPAVNALLAGTVDLIYIVPPDAIPTIESTPGLALTVRPGPSVYNIGICTTSGPFQSKEARQALQYAIDRDAINEGALSGRATPFQAFATPVTMFYDKKLQNTYSHDVKKAKALLKQAGIAPGTTVTAIAAATTAPQPVIADIVTDQLKDVGLEVQTTLSATYVDDVRRLQPNIAFSAISQQFWPVSFGSTPSAGNLCGWNDPQVTADLATMNDPTKTSAERRAAGIDAQKIVLEESPIIVMLNAPSTTAHTDTVGGIEAISFSGPNLSTVYMTK